MATHSTLPVNQRSSSGITRALVEKSFATSFESLPADIIELSKQCLMDWLGVTIAGASEPLVEILVEQVKTEGSNPQASLIGRPERVSVTQAALVNGAASHALDYDDVNLSIEGHPSVAVIPGLLALAESRESSGANFIAAFTAGYETACRVGLLVAPGHYRHGFHATATVGSLGAAAACAHLLGLDQQRTAFALGIAGTQAAGLKSMFGTMCKPLHAGKAAQNGLLAASLAARGFDSRQDILECEQGFAATHSQDFSSEAALAEPQNGFHMRANLFKYHAACYLTHAAIECVRRLRQQASPDALRKVVIRVAEDCDKVCNIAAPRTGLQAKFSLRLTTAFALAGLDTALLETYSDAGCADSQIIALRDKVHVELVSGWPLTKTEVKLLLGNGSILVESHDSSIPATDLPDQRRRLESKFHSLVDPVFGVEESNHLIALISRLEALPSLRLIGDRARGKCLA